MDKLAYLDALKRAMLGLAPDVQAKTLAWYEQRFVDGVAGGRLETDIARELDDPKKVALTLRANSHMAAFAAQKNPASLVRGLLAGVGLLIFNLFMVIPAAVVGALLAALYVGAFALYLGGIAVTAGGLAGANELVFDGPLRHVVDGVVVERTRTRVSIDQTGIEVSEEKDPDAAVGTTPERSDDSSGARVVRRAERMAGSGLRISTDLDPDARAAQTALGFSAVLGGIVLFLLSIVLTRHAALGVKRYLQMNLSLLRGS